MSGKHQSTVPGRQFLTPLVNSVHHRQDSSAKMHSTAAHPAGSAAGVHMAQPLACHAHTLGRGSWLRRVSSLLLRPAVLHTAGSATRLGASDQWRALGVDACHRSAILPPAATPSDVDAAVQQRAASPHHADDQQESAYLTPLSAEQRAAVTAPVDAHVRWAYWLIHPCTLHAADGPLQGSLSRPLPSDHGRGRLKDPLQNDCKQPLIRLGPLHGLGWWRGQAVARREC